MAGYYWGGRIHAEDPDQAADLVRQRHGQGRLVILATPLPGWFEYRIEVAQIGTFQSGTGGRSDERWAEKGAATVFSNGTEYELFRQRWCHTCVWFVHFEDGQPCPVEDAMAFAAIDPAAWPGDAIFEDKHGRVAGCRRWTPKGGADDGAV